MTSPYRGYPPSSFWRTAVAEHPPFDVSGLWNPKFRFDRAPIVTAGSCFAQHFGQALRAAGLDWHICEPGPKAASPEMLRKYNYGVFSARTANIYTTKMLLQWLEMAFGRKPWDEGEVWTKEGESGFFDPLRPTIEPQGFTSEKELFASRSVTLGAIRTTLEKGCVFVFTLGLTEAWENKETGLQCGMCPEAADGIGKFDPLKHVFVNPGFSQVHKDLRASIDIIRDANPANKVLLTVSPVPLTATASGNHVLTATVRSKSILRAVAADFAERLKYVDYFPSYEMITGIPFRSMWYQPNLRQVTSLGVDFVMRNFFLDHERRFGALKRSRGAENANQSRRNQEDVVCEEALLEAFA
jgi:hypothetical protein